MVQEVNVMMVDPDSVNTILHLRVERETSEETLGNIQTWMVSADQLITVVVNSEIIQGDDKTRGSQSCERDLSLAVVNKPEHPQTMEGNVRGAFCKWSLRIWKLEVWSHCRVEGAS